MLDMRFRRPCVWDGELRPKGHNGDGGFAEKEPFEAWWDRHQARLGHLHPQIVEQWVFRHWDGSYSCFADLSKLRWTLSTWRATDIIQHAHMEYGRPIDPVWDYRAMTEGLGPTFTAQDMRDKPWSMPLLLFSTPNGLLGEVGEMPDVRFVIAEGSKRFRYLNALIDRGEAQEAYPVFVLTSEDFE